MEQKKVRLKVQGLTNSQLQSGAFALVLSDEGRRRLPVIVGLFEAQSIAVAIERINPSRPLTHDLFIAFLKATGYKIVEVFIAKFKEGVFFSEIIFSNGEQTLKIDSRTSDAIAIAIRANCYIFTTEAIMKKCSIVFDESSASYKMESVHEELTADDLQDMSKLTERLNALKKNELKERLEKAIIKEDYEFAKIYNDELARRESTEKKSKI